MPRFVFSSNKRWSPMWANTSTTVLCNFIDKCLAETYSSFIRWVNGLIQKCISGHKKHLWSERALSGTDLMSYLMLAFISNITSNQFALNLKQFLFVSNRNKYTIYPTYNTKRFYSWKRIWRTIKVREWKSGIVGTYRIWVSILSIV